MWCNCLKMRTDWLIQCSICLCVNLRDDTHLCIAVLYSVQVIHTCNAVKGVSCLVLLAHPPKMPSMPLPVHFQNCSENKQRKTAKASEFWSDQGHALLYGNPTIQYFWRIPGKNIMKKTYSLVDQSNIQSIEYLEELLSSLKQTKILYKNKHKANYHTFWTRGLAVVAQNIFYPESFQMCSQRSSKSVFQ